MLRISIITITFLFWCSFNLEAAPKAVPSKNPAPVNLEAFLLEDPAAVTKWLRSRSLDALEVPAGGQHVNLKEERFNREKRKAFEKDLLEIQWKKLSERKALLDQEKISAKDRIINLSDKLERKEISAEEFSPQRQKLEAEIEHALEPQIKEAADQLFQCSQKIEGLRSNVRLLQWTGAQGVGQGLLDAGGPSGSAPTIEQDNSALKNIEYLASHINRITNQGHLEKFALLSKKFQHTFHNYFCLLFFISKAMKLQESPILNRIAIWDGIEKKFSDSRSFFNGLKYKENDNVLALFQAQELFKFLIQQLSSNDQRYNFFGKEGSAENVSFEYLLYLVEELASSEELTYDSIEGFFGQLSLLFNKNILRLLYDAWKESSGVYTFQNSGGPLDTQEDGRGYFTVVSNALLESFFELSGIAKENFLKEEDVVDPGRIFFPKALELQKNHATGEYNTQLMKFDPQLKGNTKSLVGASYQFLQIGLAYYFLTKIGKQTQNILKEKIKIELGANDAQELETEIDNFFNVRATHSPCGFFAMPPHLMYNPSVSQVREALDGFIYDNKDLLGKYRKILNSFYAVLLKENSFLFPLVYLTYLSECQKKELFTCNYLSVVALSPCLPPPVYMHETIPGPYLKEGFRRYHENIVEVLSLLKDPSKNSGKHAKNIKALEEGVSQHGLTDAWRTAGYTETYCRFMLSMFADKGMPSLHRSIVEFRGGLNTPQDSESSRNLREWSEDFVRDAQRNYSTGSSDSGELIKKAKERCQDNAFLLLAEAPYSQGEDSSEDSPNKPFTFKSLLNKGEVFLEPFFLDTKQVFVKDYYALFTEQLQKIKRDNDEKYKSLNFWKDYRRIPVEEKKASASSSSENTSSSADTTEVSYRNRASKQVFFQILQTKAFIKALNELDFKNLAKYTPPDNLGASRFFSFISLPASLLNKAFGLQGLDTASASDVLDIEYPSFFPEHWVKSHKDLRKSLKFKKDENNELHDLNIATVSDILLNPDRYWNTIVLYMLDKKSRYMMDVTNHLVTDKEKRLLQGLDSLGKAADLAAEEKLIKVLRIISSLSQHIEKSFEVYMRELMKLWVDQYYNNVKDDATVHVFEEVIAYATNHLGLNKQKYEAALFDVKEIDTLKHKIYKASTTPDPKPSWFQRMWYYSHQIDQMMRDRKEKDKTEQEKIKEKCAKNITEKKLGLAKNVCSDFFSTQFLLGSITANEKNEEQDVFMGVVDKKALLWPMANTEGPLEEVSKKALEEAKTWSKRIGYSLFGMSDRDMSVNNKKKLEKMQKTLESSR